MKPLQFIFATLLFLLSTGIQANNSTALPKKKLPSTGLTKLDETFTNSLASFNVPGMAIAIVKDGEVILSKGYGVKNSKTGEKVDNESLFAIASNSKAFTSAALAILVDEKKVSWNDKVRKHLPWFSLYSAFVSEEMTIRDLLCHRSGLATFSGDLIWYGTTHSREEVIRRAQYLEPVYGFRESYGYSNIMFLAAGEIVAKVSGQSWDDFIKQRFFTPLGMTHSNTTVRELNMKSGNVASPHNEVMGKNIPIDYVNWDNIGPAGSINSCVADLSNWIKLQLGKGTLNGKTYWSESRAYEMWENLTPKPVSKWQRENMPSRHFNGYGLGWELMEYGGKKVISHGGGYDGMISKTVLVPELNLGFVILTNNISSLSSCLTYAILDDYCNVPVKKDWVATFLQFKKEDEEATTKAALEDAKARVQNTKPSLALASYCGTYSSDMYGDVDISQNAAGELLIDFKPTALFKGKLSHWHYDTFELSWTTQMMLPKGKATFVLGMDGKPNEIKIVVENPDFDFTELKLLKKS